MSEYIEELRVAGNKEERAKLEKWLSTYYPAFKIVDTIGLNDKRAWEDRIDYVVKSDAGITINIDTKTRQNTRSDQIFHLNLISLYFKIKKRYIHRLHNKVDWVVIFRLDGSVVQVQEKELFKRYQDIPRLGKEWEDRHQKNTKCFQYVFDLDYLIEAGLCKIYR